MNSHTDLNVEVSKLNEWIPEVEYKGIDTFAIEVKNAIRGIKFGVLATGKYNA